MAMRTEEVRMKEGYFVSNHDQVVVPVSDNTKLLGDNMQTFLLSSFCRHQSEFDACTKPAKNVSGKEMHNFFNVGN